MQLTDEQRTIIQLGLEHCVITAVAGSGKTTTLAWRIRHLLEQGCDPRRMLVLMFNKQARIDFERKLAEVCAGLRTRLPEVRTYHAMGLRLYQRLVSEGYLPAWQGDPLGEQAIHYQLWQLLRQLTPEDQQESIKRNRKDAIQTASLFIDRIKTRLVPVETAFEQLGYEPRQRYLIDVFHGFEQWRKRGHKITYADMLYEPVMAIHQQTALQQLISNKMDLILVDEYQDTNEIQHLLLRYIAGERARITVVGDPDQTIYEFRGARPEFIQHRFADEFENPAQLSLSHTFRYGHRLALLANHLISHNQGRGEVLCQASAGTPDTRIEVHHLDDEESRVVDIIKHWLSRGGRTDQIAILFRLWSQSVALELRLLSEGLPYRMYSERGALFTSEAQAVISLLQLASGQLTGQPIPARHAVFQGLLRFPHCGLRETELAELAQQMAMAAGTEAQLLQAVGPHHPPHVTRSLRKLSQALSALPTLTGSASRCLRHYMDQTDLLDGLRNSAFTREGAEERAATISGFLRYLLRLNLNAGDTLEQLESLRQQASKPGQQGIQLATMHRTKGLEWPLVIIPGLNDKHLPCLLRATDQPRAQIESERRLFYVAMTRAQQELHLLAPPENGQAAPEQQPSRFLAELEHALSDELGAQLLLTETAPALKNPVSAIAKRYAALQGRTLTETAKKTEPDNVKNGQKGNTLTVARQGQTVKHSVFGSGKVISEGESAFEVHFLDGRVLNFSKRTAHRYFTV